MTYVSEFPIAYIEHAGGKQNVVAPPAQTLPPAPDAIELERRKLEEEMKRKMEEEAARIAAEMKSENERLKEEAEQLKKQLSSNKGSNFCLYFLLCSYSVIKLLYLFTFHSDLNDFH